MSFTALIAPADDSFSEVGATGAALQRVADRPIVCHVLEALRRAGVKHVALLTGPARAAELTACIAAEGPAELTVEHVRCAEGPGADGALRAAARLLGDAPCVVHAADGLLAQPLAPLLAALDDSRDVLAFAHRRGTANGSIGLTTRRVLRMAGTVDREGGLELAGVCLLGRGLLPATADARAWRSGELDPVAFAERLGAAGTRIGVELVGGWRRNAGEVEDLLELNRIAFDALLREPHPPSGAERVPDGAGNRIEGYVEVHRTARVRASVVVGPARIGPDAEVLDSYIGPYTSIGAGARIESAEVERSIIMPGASILHIGGRLVGSVVGRDARIFRDFSLPRALRVNVGDGNEVALC